MPGIILLFTFITRGMNYTDMMVLKWQDIDENKTILTLER